jgi:hypothetical protein
MSDQQDPDQSPVKRKMGRPKFEPTDRDRQQVRTLCAMGIPHLDIARILTITAPTLRKYFRRELDTGQAEANAKVAQSLFRQATDARSPNVAAAIFWMKARAGWSDRPWESGHETPAKKQERLEAAEKVGTDGNRFAPGRVPRLVVNND